ncbi:MAG TPA: hypothetical protein VF581_07745 [Flavobacterium sp.]|jgi:hypothetical protein
MNKAEINSQRIQKNADQFKETDVVQFNIQNYSTTLPVSFTWNNIERTLPPADATLKVPTFSFGVDALGLPFDAEIDFRFPGGGTGDVIVDYSKIKTC